MATEPTGMGFTVTVAAATLPPLVATMAMVPALTPATSPEVDTVATALLLDDQVTVRPLSVLPAESFTVAVSCAVPPIVIESSVGAMVSDPTGTKATFTVAVPDFVPLVPVICACPDPTAVNIAVNGPVAVTVATPGVFETNATVAPAIRF